MTKLQGIRPWVCACLGFCGVGLSALAFAQTQVNVVGLFSGKAVLMINGGTPQTLSAGQTKNGVKLIAADSQKPPW